MKQIRVTLNPAGVAQPVQRAALIATDVVAACLTAFAEGNLGRPEMPDQLIHIGFIGPEWSSDERRAIYKSWLLAKGFQDLARGVRETLEEALLYLEVLRWKPGPMTLTALETKRAKLHKRVLGFNFPQLMAEVNRGLTSRVAFEEEFLSMQRVRNCLEHRRGIIGVQDLDKGDSALTLRVPRPKIFYMRNGEQVEVRRDEPVDAQDGEPEVDILCRLETRSVRYEMGQRIEFTATDFRQIAAACYVFAHDLANKLPTLPQT